MAPFARLIHFEAEDGHDYFADIGPELLEAPSPGSRIEAFKTYREVVSGGVSEPMRVKKLLTPLPRTDTPIYCVGLNYQSHAKEANLKVPKYPSLWPKPAAALANPGQDILLNSFCAQGLPDFEGELVFVTSKECKDISPAEAENCILGFTLGNDLSCRLHQSESYGGGQYFFAKGFDNFAPIGPTLVGFEHFSFKESLTVRVNGRIMQETNFKDDMVFTPAQVLSHMSQGTTIPAFTAVMTGTPAGVGVWRKPKEFLNSGDVVEVTLPGVGELRNKIVFK